MAEYALRYERQQNGKKQLGEAKLKIDPFPLRWRVTSKMKEILDEQIQTFDKLADDLELDCVHFEDFGKERIKSLQVSPDGFVQLSMQLAHFR